jgi:uncharacterized protein YbjT (DUF2867 family)
MNILVTGASGYIGGRLVPRLVSQGHHVVCLVRRPEKLPPGSWEDAEIRQADLLDLDSLAPAMRGIQVAYYLVHSMADGTHGYVERDHAAAEHFGEAARQAGIERIIYLGGLGECSKHISAHLEARQVVGDKLRLSGLPVTEFRAAIVIGSGSMSFEMIRYLTERLPILLTPPWISTLCQPIAIENVLEYLTNSLTEPQSIGSIYEIGGPEVLTYAQIMREYAQVRRLKRALLTLPVLPIGLLALGADLVTPLPAPYLHILIDGLRSEVVVRDPSAQQVFRLNLIPYHTAIKVALQRDGSGEVGAYWSGGQADLTPGRVHKMVEGMYIAQERRLTPAEPEAVYKIFSGIGGKRGWFFANGLWWLRGLLDQLAGGVGMARGRPDPDVVHPGDPLDGWRVDTVKVGRLMRLSFEMKAPGPAWLQFEAQPNPEGGTLLVLTAFFEPHGLAGLTYWYALYPFHRLIFNGLTKSIIRQAEALPKNKMV